MIGNSFKHSIRALYRQKAYLIINLIGLSIGIACSMIIALFILHELSYDQYNKKKDRIYRLIVNGKIENRELSYAVTPVAIGPAMLRDFPEVENFLRMQPARESKVKYQDKTFIENSFLLADSSFFDLFSIELKRGDIHSVLNASHKIVLSETTAKKIFGLADPMDKMLKIEDDSVPFVVSGIMADIPENSHFNANMLASFISYNRQDDNWNDNNFITYILLKPNVEVARVNSKIPAMLIKFLGPAIKKSFGISMEEFIAKNNYNIYLQPLKNIHLNTSITQLTKLPANPKYLFIFGAIAIFIIIIAAFNYMNLSTTQAFRRAKEVGIKKLSGSTKALLVQQFLSESLLLSFVSLGFAVIIVENSLPYFSRLLSTNLQVNYFSHWYIIPLLIGLSIVIGILSGAYPSFFLASYNPYKVLKGKLRDGMKNSLFRKSLVIVQFSISIILIIGTIIMFRQIHFLLKKDLGFNKEELMVISRAGTIGNGVNSFKESLAKIPGVVHAAFSTAVPGRSESGTTYSLDGRPGELYEFHINYVDYDFFDTYGINLAAGRNFRKEFLSDNTACIVNESTIKQLSINNPLSSAMKSGNDVFPLIGVVKNFHYESLQNQINPYVFKLINPSEYFEFISIKLHMNNNPDVVKEIENLWKKYAADTPIQYYFIDQDFDQKYKEERQNSRLSVIFTIIAIIIASLGLFGLSSLNLEQRTKEIGIRKTMGASVTGIFYLLSREFLILVVISTAIAWPLVYLISKNWLQNYYYRISLQPADFIAGFFIALFIAVLTIAYRTLISSRANPVESLRYE